MILDILIASKIEVFVHVINTSLALTLKEELFGQLFASSISVLRPKDIGNGRLFYRSVDRSHRSLKYQKSYGKYKYFELSC